MQFRSDESIQHFQNESKLYILVDLLENSNKSRTVQNDIVKEVGVEPKAKWAEKILVDSRKTQSKVQGQVGE